MVIFILKNKNNMKTIKIAGTIIITMLLTGRLFAQDGEKTQQLVVPLSQPGKPFKLDVGLLSGSITVSTYEGKDVIIDVQGGEGRRGHGDERVNGMKRLDANNMSVQAEELDNRVTVHGDANKKADLTIKIPQNEVDLKLHTVNDGNINVSNASGELEISNVNGYIKLNNISGSVVANTVNGKVEVTFKTIDPKAPMAFSTLNGNVDVTFPVGLKANVKLKSDRGDIYTDFDVVTEQHKPNVTRSSNSGMLSLKIEDWVYGKIDGGGPEILMKNMNGNIYIRKAK
jgi:Putative adhesin